MSSYGEYSNSKWNNIEYKERRRRSNLAAENKKKLSFPTNKHTHLYKTHLHLLPCIITFNICFWTLFFFSYFCLLRLVSAPSLSCSSAQPRSHICHWLYLSTLYSLWWLSEQLMKITTFFTFNVQSNRPTPLHMCDVPLTPWRATLSYLFSSLMFEKFLSSSNPFVL